MYNVLACASYPGQNGITERQTTDRCIKNHAYMKSFDQRYLSQQSLIK